MSRFAAAAALARSPALRAYGLLGAAAAASFLTTIILARVAGPSVIGDYAFAMSTATLATAAVLMGLDRILVREVAGDLRVGESARARRTIVAITARVGLVSVLAAGAYLLLVRQGPLIGWIGGDPHAMALVALSILAWPMLRLGWSGLRATGAPLWGQLFEGLPTLLLMAAVVVLWQAHGAPDAAQVTGIAIAIQLACAMGAWLLLAPRVRGWNPGAAPLPPGLLTAGLPFMSILFLQTFSDWFVLASIGNTAGAADVGAFRVAVQVAGLVSMIVTTTESYVAPRLAGDFRAGRADLAWARHRRATIIMLLLAAPLLLVAILAPRALLGLAFGPEFTGAATALAILAAGQLITVARGPLGSMLSMSGNDRLQLQLTLGGLAIVLLCGFTLIPRYGLVGAALTSVAPLAFRSIVGTILIRRLVPRPKKPR